MARTNKKNRRRKAQAEDNYENQLEVGTVLDTSGVGETSGANVEVLQRWETHFSKKLRQDIMGVELKLEQSPGSDHLGTTVWDASIVLAKYLEKVLFRSNSDVYSRILARASLIQCCLMSLTRLIPCHNHLYSFWSATGVIMSMV
uniref:Uncharacterized protein n=1 Tax=Tetraselmis sp. GSL018 TaxID=582737 RepID=A0A061RPL3_9CHLO